MGIKEKIKKMYTRKAIPHIFLFVILFLDAVGFTGLFISQAALEDMLEFDSYVAFWFVPILPVPRIVSDIFVIVVVIVLLFFYGRYIVKLLHNHKKFERKLYAMEDADAILESLNNTEASIYVRKGELYCNSRVLLYIGAKSVFVILPQKIRGMEMRTARNEVFLTVSYAHDTLDIVAKLNIPARQSTINDLINEIYVKCNL